MLKRLILVELHAGVQISNKELAVKSKLLNMLRRIQDFEKGGSNKWAAKGGPIWGWSGGMLPLEILKFKSSEMRFPALWGMMVDDLRTSLCKTQTSWEIKIFNPLRILHVVRQSGVCTKMPFLKVAALLLPWQQRLLVQGLGPHFHTKTSQKKKVKCLFLYPKLNTTLQIGTCTMHSDIIHLHFDPFNFPWEWMWTHQ